jgi:hypothetical protein
VSKLEGHQILHPTPYTLHPTPYTLHPTLYTLGYTSHTLHPQTLIPQPTQCVKVLVSVLSSEGTAARLFSLSRDAPDEWAKFSSSLVRNVTMEGQPKLSKLASVVRSETQYPKSEFLVLSMPLHSRNFLIPESVVAKLSKVSTQNLYISHQVRILSSPSLSSFAVEPELLGEDGLGDEVIRRTLMLAVWSAIDKSNHRMCGILSGEGGESSLLELSPLLHDIRMLQGARSNYFMYNVWLSTLFVLHGAKPGTTEAAVAQVRINRCKRLGFRNAAES